MRKTVAVIELANLLSESIPETELSQRMDIAIKIIDKLEALGMRPPQVEEQYIGFNGEECSILVDNGWE